GRTLCQPITSFFLPVEISWASFRTPESLRGNDEKLDVLAIRIQPDIDGGAGQDVSKLAGAARTQDLDPRGQGQHPFHVPIEHGEAALFQVEGLDRSLGQEGHLDVHVHDPLVDRLYPKVRHESLGDFFYFQSANGP